MSASGFRLILYGNTHSVNENDYSVVDDEEDSKIYINMHKLSLTWTAYFRWFIILPLWLLLLYFYENKLFLFTVDFYFKKYNWEFFQTFFLLNIILSDKDVFFKDHFKQN